MKRLKTGIATLVIGALAITAVAVAAQSPTATPAPDQPTAEATDQAQPPQPPGRPGRGGFGFGNQFQVIADALGEDLATLRSDLQSGKSIADIAKDKNVDLSTIVDAVVAKQADNLKTAVTNGRLTQEQADAQTALLKANLTAMFNTKMDQQGNRPTFGAQQANPEFDIIAAALGEDAATFQSDLQSGKTVADIAKDKNVDLSKVVDAVVAQHQTALTAAVTDGRLTQDQADAQIALLKANLNVEFTKKANGRGGFGFFGGLIGRLFGGFGGFDGPMGGFGGFGRPGRGQGNGGFGFPGGNRPGGNRPGRPGNGNGGPGSNAPGAEATAEATANA